MIHTCPRCKKDFLDEADMHIITPVKNYEASCMCIYRDAKQEITKLKELVKVMREGLEFYGDFENWNAVKDGRYKTEGIFFITRDNPHIQTENGNRAAKILADNAEILGEMK